MFGKRATFRERLFQIIQLFRQKGATSNDKAMTIEELGLSPRFEELMKGRLGQSGIFVESNGRYYLSEERLKEVQERIAARRNIDGSSTGRRQFGMRNIFLLRMTRAIMVTVLLCILIANILFPSYELRVLSAVLFVVLLILSLVQIYYLMKFRKIGKRRSEYQEQRQPVESLSPINHLAQFMIRK